MPSKKSNRNRLKLPASVNPPGRRCIPVSVPDDPEYIALFLGAIYRLSQQIWYDRDPEHKAKQVAAVWHQVYLDLMDSLMTGQFCAETPQQGCIDYAPNAPMLQYAPNDPFQTPDLTPEGYLLPPWYANPAIPL